MRIDSSGSTQTAADASNLPSRSVSQAGSSADAQEVVFVAPGAAAEFSSQQGRIQALAAQVNQFPEIRQQKVAALAQLVQEGKYDVSPEQTAESLLAELQARQVA